MVCQYCLNEAQWKIEFNIIYCGELSEKVPETFWIYAELTRSFIWIELFYIV